MTPASIAAQGSEDAHQTAYFMWCAMQLTHCPELAFCFAIPNGGMRNMVVAMKMKAAGVKPGVPDICLPVPMPRGDGSWYAGLWIELKKLKKGDTKNANQLRWAAFLRGQGYAHHLCTGYLAAIDATKSYLGPNRQWRDEV